jgi:hypothetical protein
MGDVLQFPTGERASKTADARDGATVHDLLAQIDELSASVWADLDELAGKDGTSR